MSGTFVPGLTLHTDEGTITVAELREVVEGDRVDVHSAKAGDRPADAVLIRPDGYIAWAAPVDQSGDTVAAELREALSSWC